MFFSRVSSLKSRRTMVGSRLGQVKWRLFKLRRRNDLCNDRMGSSTLSIELNLTSWVLVVFFEIWDVHWCTTKNKRPNWSLHNFENGSRNFLARGVVPRWQDVGSTTQYVIPGTENYTRTGTNIHMTYTSPIIRMPSIVDFVHLV